MPLRNISELSYYLSTLKEVDKRWRRQKRHLKWRFKIHSKQITEQWCHCLRPIATNTPIISGFKWLTEHASRSISLVHFFPVPSFIYRNALRVRHFNGSQSWISYLEDVYVLNRNPLWLTHPTPTLQYYDPDE